MYRLTAASFFYCLGLALWMTVRLTDGPLFALLRVSFVEK
jgi:hypothetical protein